MSRAMQFDVVANDKASATMAQVDKSMQKFGKNMGSSLTMVAGRAMAIVATLKTITATINEMGNVADDAARLGVSVETYQRLKFAAEDYGSSIEEIAKAQKDVNKLLDAAATKGAGPEMDTLKALGFSEKDVLDRTIKQAEVWERLGEAIQGATTEEEKFAVASRVLGDKISTSMLPVLENYKEFESIMASTTTMSQKNAENLDKLGTKLNGFWQFTKSLAGEAAGYVAGKVIDQQPTVAMPVTPQKAAENASRRAALLKIGAKPGEAGGAASAEVSSMMAIGGASFRGFNNVALARPIEEQQLAALEQIASNTAQAAQAPAPSPGATDPTKGDPLAGVVNRIYKIGEKNPNNYERYKTMRPAR